MAGNTARFLPPRSVAPRIRGAKLRRQTPAAPVAPVPEAETGSEDEVTDGISTESDTEPGEIDSPSDSESDIEEEVTSSLIAPGQQPAPTPAPALEGSRTTERVIPTLTPITHAPRPIPPIFAGEDPQKGDKEVPLTRITTSDYPYPTDDVVPGGVGAGVKPTSTEENSSIVTGAKGLLESGDADGDDLTVVENSPSGGGLNAGAKAGIAVGTIAGVALIAGLLFFLWRWKRSRKGHRLDDSAPELPYSNANLPPGQSQGPSATIDPRSNSQILDDLIAASYAHQNGVTLPAGGGWTSQDEKRDLENIGNITPQSRQIDDPQPQIRFSIASWLRRHHPLKLNPLGSKRGSMASTAVSSNSINNKASPAIRDSTATSVLDVKTMMRSRFHDSVRPDQSVSQRNTMATEVTNSVYDYYARPESQQPQDAIPPLPPVYTGNKNDSTSGQGQGQTKTQQLAAKYQSVWSDSTATTNTTTSGVTTTTTSGQIPIGIPSNVGRVNVDSSVYTDPSSAGTSVLFMYEGSRPVTGLTNITTGASSSVYPAPLDTQQQKRQDDPLPVSPLSPSPVDQVSNFGKGNLNNLISPPGNGGPYY